MAPMSEGRTMPAIVRMRSSALTRTSCEPVMTRLPLGNTLVTTAATCRSMLSDRAVAPAPFEDVPVPSVASALAALPTPSTSKPPPNLKLRLTSRLRSDWFLNCALSLIEIWTVRMSPTDRARGSVNRRLWLSFHSE